MKTVYAIICFAITIVSPFHCLSQTRNFDGIWTAKMTTNEGKTFTLKLYIEDNNVHDTVEDEEGNLREYYGKEVIISKGYGEHLTFVWMDKGQVWTETQIYSIVWINSQNLSVTHIRHVSNKKDNSGINTDWHYTSTGILKKT